MSGKSWILCATSYCISHIIIKFVSLNQLKKVFQYTKHDFLKTLFASSYCKSGVGNFQEMSNTKSILSVLLWISILGIKLIR